MDPQYTLRIAKFDKNLLIACIILQILETAKRLIVESVDPQYTLRIIRGHTLNKRMVWYYLRVNGTQWTSHNTIIHTRQHLVSGDVR